MKDIAWLFSMSTKSVLFAKRFCKEGNWLLNCPLLNLNSVLHVRILGVGVAGRPDPFLKNHKNIGFSSNTGPDHLKNRSYQARIQCWAIIKPGFNVGPPSAVSLACR